MSVEAAQAFIVRPSGRDYLLADRVPGMKIMVGHIHSNIDDGRLSPKRIVDKAVEAEVPFVAITDHNNPEGAEKAANYITHERLGKNITAVRGTEVTTVRQTKKGPKHEHLLALGVQGNIPSGRSMEETIDLIHEDGGVAILPHVGVPRAESISFADARRLLKGSTAPDGIEVWNSSAQTLHLSPFTRREFPEDYSVMAEELRKEFPGSVAAFGGSDAHGRRINGVYTGFYGDDPIDAIRRRETKVLVKGDFGFMALGSELASRKPVQKEIRRVRERLAHQR